MRRKNVPQPSQSAVSSNHSGVKKKQKCVMWRRPGRGVKDESAKVGRIGRMHGLHDFRRIRP